MIRLAPDMLRRLRPLPVTIGAMSVLVLCKLAILAQVGAPAALATAQAVLPAAYAASGPEPKPAPASPARAPGAPQPTMTPAATPAATPVAATPLMPTPGSAASEPAPEPAAAIEPAPDDAERALLQDLRARRSALDTRAQSIESREELVAAAEKRLSERLDQLGAMQARLEALEQTRRERDEANWRGLVKTYEAMRPRDAAAIFNDLEQSVLIEVLDRMKEAKAALILGAMQPDRARLATAHLAEWRNRTSVEARK